jgi:hypothetical protein
VWLSVIKGVVVFTITESLISDLAGPTWSWASLDYSTAVFGSHPSLPFATKVLARIISAQVETTTGNPFTNIASGCIKIQGRLRRVSLELLGTTGQRGILPYSVDLGPYSFVGPCYLLPIVREFKDVYSLLLRRVRRVPRCQDDNGLVDDGQQEVFERVGLSKIGIHATQVIKTLPDGMEWLRDFATVKDILRQTLDTVVIY